MAAPLKKAEIDRRVEAIHDALRAGHKPETAPTVAALALGMSSNSLRNWLADQIERGVVKIDWSQYRGASPQRPAIDPPEPRPAGPSAPAQRPGVIIEESLVGALRKGPLSLDAIAARFGVTKGQALDALDAATKGGMNIHEAGGLWSITEAHPRFNPATMDYVSREDDTFVFGITSDNHFASKQSRHDVLESLYDIFEREGVDRAFNGGNYLEGERDFNRFELTVHGLDAQVAHLVKHFPQRPGIITYAVSGDDHEAWWSQKTGLDIGRRVEQDMRDAGRMDWVNAGFIEADFRLVNAVSGASSILRIVHPGGGSAYAISYKAQKYIESLEGGTKPAIVSFGHWHKMFSFNYRGVWCMGSGCTKDQDIFMRKGALEAHVGGLLVRATQDRRTGAIVRCAVEQIRFFDRGYYENGKWSYAGDVVQPKRSIGGV